MRYTFTEEIIPDIFIIGAKGFRYGGYESFLDKLTEYHQNKNIQYHIACKLNGQGVTDEADLDGIQIISDTEFIYHNAHCFKLKSWNFGSAQAILYDIKALRYCYRYIKKNHVKYPIIYILSSRIGPVMWYYSRKIHQLGGQYWNNPDGRENLRRKYKPIVRKYWKLSEKLMVKHSDLVICDSKNIEKYICEEYTTYKPRTTYIAYGSEIRKSILPDDDPKFVDWLKEFNLSRHDYYLIVGRFVPENNYEIMIREFMKSDSKRDFAIITNVNDKLLDKLESKLHFKNDRRIKFVGTVYDKELLMKIRENAYAYFHGHEVGGTNPSLLEALGSTNLNLLLDVSFNREVAEDAALYWNKDCGNLANLINQAECMNETAIYQLGELAKKRIFAAYRWEFIANEYEKAFKNIKVVQK